MDYKQMFDAIEGKLRAELRIYKNIMSSYKSKGLNASYSETRIDGIENTIAFIEELKRIKEDVCVKTN